MIRAPEKVRANLALGIPGPRDLNETFGVRGYIPRHVSFSPVVFLDSGQSVDETVFLEGWRRWLWFVKHKRRPKAIPRVWMLYPNKHHWARVGSAPVSGFENWEIRPVRWEKDLYPEGFFRTVAGFEDGAKWAAIGEGLRPEDFYPPPWRWLGRKKRPLFRRPIHIYPNPTAEDIRWATAHKKYWTNPRRSRALYSLQPYGALPRFVVSGGTGVFTLEKDYERRVNEAMGEKFAHPVAWWNFWSKEEEPAHYVSVASSWRHEGRFRWPEVVMGWARQAGFECHQAADTGRWEDIADATSCRYYFVASTKETMPWDALIAHARGAKVVGPDTPLFRKIFDSRWLYPVHESGHDVLAWTQAEVREWFLNRLRQAEKNHG